jgi:hypothetical protein
VRKEGEGFFFGVLISLADPFRNFSSDQGNSAGGPTGGFANLALPKRSVVQAAKQEHRSNIRIEIAFRTETRSCRIICIVASLLIVHINMTFKVENERHSSMIWCSRNQIAGSYIGGNGFSIPAIRV